MNYKILYKNNYLVHKESRSKYKGGFQQQNGRMNNTKAYNHDYYINNKQGVTGSGTKDDPYVYNIEDIENLARIIDYYGLGAYFYTHKVTSDTVINMYEETTENLGGWNPPLTKDNSYMRFRLTKKGKENAIKLKAEQLGIDYKQEDVEALAIISDFLENRDKLVDARKTAHSRKRNISDKKYEVFKRDKVEHCQSSEGGIAYMEEYKNELYHFGVLGMRWGIRRYQDKNGRLTPAGKKKRQKLYEHAERLEKKATKKSRYILKNKDDYGPSELKKAKANVDLNKKLTSIRKKEIDKGFNYFERNLSQHTWAGAFIGGVPGAVISGASNYYTWMQKSSDTMYEREKAIKDYQQNYGKFKYKQP